MKILYLTFYFEPDICAGSFRNSPLVKELSRLLSPDDSIHVLTTMPNRYHSFSLEAPEYEETNNISIQRIQLSQHKSGFIDQALAFKKYYFEVLSIIKGKEYDIVFASSSRLFTAFLGSIVSRRKKIPYYVDIRDIFVDTMKDVLKNKLFKFFLLPVLKRIEYITFQKATHINLISEGFKPYFSKYSQSTFSFFTNGIDPEFISIPASEKSVSEPFLITYAGNIGEGQGLEKIVPEAAKKLGNKYRFKIIGDGGKKAELEKKLNEENITNVELIPPTNRKNILKYYEETHYLFLHLNDYEAFKKVLPSKIFEYGATDKPVIAGVGGYAAKFIENNLTNYILFPPGKVETMVERIKENHLEYQERKEFKKKFSREKINIEMAKSIMKIAQS
jgi:glycosyltransferase involved in cell wall biosynthesis